MKKAVSLSLLLILICTLFSVSMLPAFAAEESAELQSLDEINGALAGIKETVVSLWNKMIDIVSSSETWTGIMSVLLAILAIVFIPIAIGVMLVAYALVYAMTAVIYVILAIISVFAGLVF